MERGDSSCSYAYLRAREMRRDLGRFEASPFPPWSKDDLDWLAGMDDSSGSYGEVAPIPDSANGAKASEKAPEGSCKIGTKDHQLSLLDSQEEHNSEEGQAMQCTWCDVGNPGWYCFRSMQRYALNVCFGEHAAGTQATL